MSQAPREHPSKRAADLQGRLRRLTPLLKRGEAYHVELDAIASELGELSMSLEGYDPSCHAWRAAPRPRALVAGEAAVKSPSRRTEVVIRRL